MGFCKPKTDAFAVCDKYLVAIAGTTTAEEKERLEEEKKAHQTEPDLAYDTKRQDKQAAIHKCADKRLVDRARPARMDTERTVLM